MARPHPDQPHPLPVSGDTTITRFNSKGTALPERPADLIEAFSVNVERLNERSFTFLDDAIIGVKGPIPGVASGVRARTDRNTEPR